MCNFLMYVVSSKTSDGFITFNCPRSLMDNFWSCDVLRCLIERCSMLRNPMKIHETHEHLEVWQLDPWVASPHPKPGGSFFALAVDAHPVYADSFDLLFDPVEAVDAIFIQGSWSAEVCSCSVRDIITDDLCFVVFLLTINFTVLCWERSSFWDVWRGSCSALDGLKCGLSSTPVSSRMGYTPNLSTPNLVSCLLYIGFLAISACFFLSFNHIGDFTISVSHFNAYLVLEFLSHEGILHFQDIVDEHEHCGWANPIDLTIKASTSSPFEAHGQSLGWEYSQVFAVFMWCFLFVFHCFPLISIVFHWFPLFSIGSFSIGLHIVFPWFPLPLGRRKWLRYEKTIAETACRGC